MRSDAFWEWYDTLREKLGGRADTFAKMFEYLDQQPDPICIIETGCMRSWGNWAGDGQSTLLFDRYAYHHAGCVVHSVDIDPKATALAKAAAPQVQVHTQDSIAFLKSFAELPPVTDWTDLSVLLNSGRVDVFEDGSPPSLTKIDLLYLDSFDFTPTLQIESALHHMNELMAIMPALSPQTLVVVDDSPVFNDDIKGWGIHGKGTLVADYAQLHGARTMFAQYQIGWTEMVRSEPLNLEEVVERARAHVEAGDVVAADMLYRLVLQATSPPQNGMQRVAHGEATVWFGRQAIGRRRYSMAAEYYRAALAVDPMATDYRLEMCKRALIPVGHLKEAQLEAQRAVAINPDLPEAWHVLGGVHHELGNIEKCIAAYDRQLELIPNDTDALLDRSQIALDVEDYDTVKRLVGIILGPTMKPASDTPPDLARFAEREADAYFALAIVAYRENRHTDAIELYDRAIAGHCHHDALAHWHKSISMHSLGLLREGWKEHEYRKHVLSNPAMSLPARRFTRPLWDGQEPPARIHVHYEAGAGDNLCLIRYLNLLVDRGYDVCYETDPSLLDLCVRSFPKVEVIPKTPDWPGALGLKDFDYHCPVGSLPAAFSTDLDTVPWYGPYLKPDQKLVERYRKVVPPHAIGLCWSAGIREGVWMERYGKNKSMWLYDMRPIFSKRHCVSLQVGPERSELGGHGHILDLLPREPTWDDTAALVSCLDAVVTVDTGVAHLAGALGVPVHLAMHQQGSWHWMADIEGSSWQLASPWYPRTKVYRQKHKGNWAQVIEQIGEAIAKKGQQGVGNNSSSNHIADQSS